MAMRAFLSVVPLLLASLFFSPAAARAQDLDLVGSVGWEYVGSRIAISAERVDNNRPGGRSGNLRLRLYATEQPYEPDAALEGFPMATLNLGALSSGYSFVDIYRRVTPHRFPAGVYYTVITLEERGADGDYYIVDSEGFNVPVNLGAYGYGMAEGLQSNQDVSFAGDVSWESMHGRVRITADEILNDRNGGRSGLLRLRLFATDVPFDDAEDGYELTYQRVGRLWAGRSYFNYNKRSTFRRPPEGNYYVTLMLQELGPDGWFIADYVTYPGTYLY
jgi:hypothetical protein